MHEEILPSSGRVPTEDEVIDADAKMTDAQVEGDKLRQKALQDLSDTGEECGLSKEEIKEAIRTTEYSGDSYSQSVNIKGIPVKFSPKSDKGDSFIITSVDGGSIEKEEEDQLLEKYRNFFNKLLYFRYMEHNVRVGVNNERDGYMEYIRSISASPEEFAEHLDRMYKEGAIAEASLRNRELKHKELVKAAIQKLLT